MVGVGFHYEEPTMHSLTLELKDRDPDKLKLTEEEAWALMNAGFQFAEFNPISEQYRLRAPYRMLHQMERGTVTLQQ